MSSDTPGDPAPPSPSADERYRRLVETIPHGVDEIAIDGTWTYCSPAFHRILGYEPGELVGRSSFDVIADSEQRAFLPGYLAELARTQPPPERFEADMIRKDGTVVHTAVDWNYLRDDDGATIGFVAVLTDITERVHAQRALQAAQQSLLTQERLATLGRLTAVVSHELRNPLGTIRNAITLLQTLLADQAAPKQAPLAPALSRAVELLDRSAGRCTRIVDELLDYSRNHFANPKQVALGPWLQEIVTEEALQLPVPVTVELATDDAPARIDREHLRRAVINLLSNACQAAGSMDRERSPRVHVRLRRQGDRLEIVCRDNGPGIAPEHRERVFEPLFSTKQFGIGLGLSIIREIASQHGGGIELASLPGAGLEALLWIPIATEAPAPTDNTEPAE